MNKALSRAVDLGIALASIAVLAMMLVGVTDIVATLVKFPLPGALELMEMLMVLVVFLALPEVEFRRDHIVIDLIAVRMPPPVQVAFVWTGNVLALLFYGAMGWQAWKLFWSSWSIREYATGLVAFPVYPTKGLFALGVTVVSIAALINLIRSITLPNARIAPDARSVRIADKEAL
jgi:TRAP-type C4-dicarboxylate transport system permease small subunit